MRLIDILKNKSFNKGILSLNETDTDNFIRKLLENIGNTSFLRNSEFFNEDKFGGDVIIIDSERLCTQLPLDIFNCSVEVIGNASYIMDEPDRPISMTKIPEIDGEWVDLGKLKGKNIRFVYDYIEHYSAIDFEVNGNYIGGAIWFASKFKKPYKFCKLFTFSITKDYIDISVDDNSLVWMFKFNTAQHKKFIEIATIHSRKAREIMIKFGLEENLPWDAFNNTEFVYVLISASFAFLIQNYNCTLNRDCGFDELDRGCKFKDEVLDFIPECIEPKKYESKEELKTSKLKMGTSCIKRNEKYLYLVSKVAQLGSEVVVPRNSILDFEDFKKEYFYNFEDSMSTIPEKEEELFEIIGFDKELITHDYGLDMLTFDINKIKEFYFNYVWNNLYFDLKKIWSKIRIINNDNDSEFEISFNEEYGYLEVSHVYEGEDDSEVVAFSGDVGLNDLKIKEYINNPILKSFRFDFNRLIGTVKPVKAFINCINKFKSKYPNIRLEDLILNDLEASIRLGYLNTINYSLNELISLSYLDEEKVKASILASSIEDYSNVVINYILISTLVCEKNKIKITLDELQKESIYECEESEESEKLEERYEIRKENKKILKELEKLEDSDLVTQNSNIYLFNDSKVTDIDKLLGIHLKKKRSKYAYKTPFWVRRGYSRVGKGGETIWIPEKICKRNPELLSVNASEDNDNQKIYKATDLF